MKAFVRGQAEGRRLPTPVFRLPPSSVAMALVAGIAIVFPLVYGDQSYLMSVATLILIYGLVAVTLNLLIGYGGQVSLGHAGLLAVGSYTAAILANDFSPRSRWNSWRRPAPPPWSAWGWACRRAACAATTWPSPHLASGLPFHRSPTT